uniref:PAR14-like first RRM domain-containing protein n=1 Tax=Xiphophorus couchianus TaxID=32473 RepID=A0A3B5LLT9_9TELE
MRGREEDDLFSKMAEYPYPLYFEARHLSDGEKEKVRRYFQIKRVSGGGDCVCFKKQQDQESVLNRKSHMISLPRGDLHLTVTRSSSPQTQDQPSTSQSQVSSCLLQICIYISYISRIKPQQGLELLTKHTNLFMERNIHGFKWLKLASFIR